MRNDPNTRTLHTTTTIKHTELQRPAGVRKSTNAQKLVPFLSHVCIWFFESGMLLWLAGHERVSPISRFAKQFSARAGYLVVSTSQIAVHERV